MGTRITAVAVVLFVASALHNSSAQTGQKQHVTPAESVNFTPMDPKEPNGMRVSVISGRLEGPGAVTFFVQPGNAPHGDECLSTECLFIARYEGPLDNVAVPEK